MEETRNQLEAEVKKEEQQQPQVRSVHGVVYDPEKDDSCLGKYREKPETKEQKIQYFKDYYLKVIIAGILIAATLFYVLKTTIYDYKETAFAVMVLEDAPESLNEFSEALRTELEAYLELEDTKSISEVSIMDTETAMDGPLLMARFAAGDLDIMIADREVFEHYLQLGTFENLEDILEDQKKDSWRDDALRGSILHRDPLGNVLSAEEEAWYGICLNGNQLADLTKYLKEPVMGIVVNKNELGTRVDTFCYLLEK